MPSTRPDASTPPPEAAKAAEAPLLAAMWRRPVQHTPVWFMRQAGRSLPEYREVRQGIPMLEACSTPDLIVEITMQPVRRYGVDAAIFFSDIVLPLRAAGVAVDIVPGVGPVMESPVRDAAAVSALPRLHPDQIDFVTDAVGALAAELGPTPLIGFAGAPFTLASYLVEGGPSRNQDRTRALMFREPDLWHALLAHLADVSATFLEVQIRAGARAVQLFDSWVGVLSEAEYREFVLPHSRAVLGRAGSLGVPRAHFGVATGELLGVMAEAGAETVGVDWRVPLPSAAGRTGGTVALQGNLDPAVLAAPWSVVEREARRILDEAVDLPGHIFNLGHGVPPETDPDQLSRLVDLVHAATARA